MTTQNTLPRSLWLLLGALTLCWGCNWPMMKLALAELPVWTFRAASITAGAIGLFIIAHMQRLRMWPPRQQWPRLLLTSFFNVTAWNVLIGYGVSMLPAGRSAILAYTMPLWTVLLSALVLREHLTARKATGIALGTGGLALLLGPELLHLGAAPAGTLVTLAAAMSWASGTVIMKRWPTDLPTTSFVAWQLCLGGAPVVIGALIVDWGAWQPISAGAVTALSYNMFVAFIFCHWAWFKIATTAPASVAAMSTMMIPAVGVTSGMLVLGERPGWHEYLALLLITLALATVLIATRGAAAAASPGQSGHAA